MNMTRKAWLVPVLAATAASWGSTLAAQDKDEQEGNQAAVAKAVLGARVPLERGLAASASHGQPISAKFERSEEHTSELQSRLHLVCRLLLEKKKKKKNKSSN